MKGPAGRGKFDVRRVWECPACGRRQRTGGQVVNLLCDCGSKNDPPRQSWMRLVEEGLKRAPPCPAVIPDDPGSRPS